MKSFVVFPRNPAAVNRERQSFTTKQGYSCRKWIGRQIATVIAARSMAKGDWARMVHFAPHRPFVARILAELHTDFGPWPLLAIRRRYLLAFEAMRALTGDVFPNSTHNPCVVTSDFLSSGVNSLLTFIGYGNYHFPGNMNFLKKRKLCFSLNGI